MNGDVAMRQFSASQSAPEFPNPAFNPLTKPLSQARVAIVTSAAIHAADDDRFEAGEGSYRTIQSEARNLVLGHQSPNFDHSGFQQDLNVVFPIDRLNELADAGVIGSVAARHYSFAGNQPDSMSTVIHDSGPACAAQLIADEVDLVLLTPV